MGSRRKVWVAWKQKTQKGNHRHWYVSPDGRLWVEWHSAPQDKDYRRVYDMVYMDREVTPIDTFTWSELRAKGYTFEAPRNV